MTHLEKISSKILNTDTIAEKLAFWKFKNQKIVFTNGCFDILHLGHIDYLSKAADMGDILIVGINTDASVKKLKGHKRPINDEISRASIIASLRFVDTVILFDEETPYSLIKTVQPDVLVKGSDYKEQDIVGFDLVKSKNGEVKTIDFLPGFSTSLIEQKIKNQ